MQTAELYFDLPEELIAQHPRENHENDRLLCINRRTGELKDSLFTDIPALLPENALLVLNDSKVRKARVFAESETGGKVELLFLSPLSDGRWKCMSNRRRRRKVGESLLIKKDNFSVVVYVDELCCDETIIIRCSDALDEKFFDKVGHVPLPPYIKRADEFKDQSSYQTIFAKHLGSVASPTSGLHYTQKTLDDIKKRGIEIVKITLHVGIGTFLPLRTDVLEEHKMHSEYYNIPQAVAEKITEYKAEGKPIIASGTTVVRTLESTWDGKKIKAGDGCTDIFITPGFEFNVVDKLITNFHTPESTLMSLVSAFSSLEIVKNAYKHAVNEKYRFFSYGDCTYFF